MQSVVINIIPWEDIQLFQLLILYLVTAGMRTKMLGQKLHGEGRFQESFKAQILYTHTLEKVPLKEMGLLIRHA